MTNDTTDDRDQENSDENSGFDPYEYWSERYDDDDVIEQPVVGYVVIERTNDTGSRYAKIQAVSQATHSPVTGRPSNSEPDWDGGWSEVIDLDEGDRIVAAFPATETVTQVLKFVGNGFGHAYFETRGSEPTPKGGDE